MSDRYKGAILSPTAPTVTPQSAGGIYTSSQQLQYQGQGVWPSAFNNPINNSLRFRSSASAYLNRTNGTPTSGSIFTFSFWVKRGTLAANQTFISGTRPGNFDRIYFSNNDTLIYQWNDGSTNPLYLETTQVFRDPSAWYHIVITTDTTQSTASNRAKIYVNGIQVTAFSSADYPTQNSTSFLNANGVAVNIGRTITGTFYFDGYLTEVNFIDGQALTPSSFGTTDAYGIWQPIPYTGAYGTNGFYLKFTDISAPTATAIGKDYSGNNNNWTPNNIGVASTNKYPLSTLTSNTTIIDGFNLFDGSLETSATVPASFDNYITFTPTTGISYTSSIRVYVYAANGYNITNYYSVNGGAETTFVGGGAGFNSNAWITVATGGGTLTSLKIRLTRTSPNASSVSWKAIEIDGVIITNNFDGMTDVPTLTNSTVANYATGSPVASYSNNITWTNGNLALAIGLPAEWRTSMIPFQLLSNKWYWEITLTATVNSGDLMVGVINSDIATTVISGNSEIGSQTFGYAYYSGGLRINAGANSAYGATWFTSGDIIGVTFDASSGDLSFYKNGVSQGLAYTVNMSKTYVPAISGTRSGGTTPSVAFNFGQQPFSYTPPTGFLPLNTYNLPTPTILAGNQYMDATTYTGDGTTSKTVTGLNFQPDWVWTKARSQSYRHAVFDVVRGFGNVLQPSFTDAEFTDGTTAGTSFFQGVTSSGFIVGLPTSGTYSGNAGTNENGTTYVGWSWKASNTSGVSNTQGTITSTVSANTTAGFSIVTFTTQASGTGTVGHGLGVAPSLIIQKIRTLSADWYVYSASIGAANILKLNTTDASTAGSTIWNSTSPTSSVFSLGNGWAGSYSTVAYCFAQVAGYSAFGSYVGNGSNDGPFIFTGFRPRYILIKRYSSSAGNAWIVWDTSRSPYNVGDQILVPNSSNAENTGTLYIDILSNGFKFRSFSNGSENASGESYLYAAFAENPFKIARAR